MSAKFLHAISDDPDLEKQLEKQIGCMAGIMQLFDRHSILTGKRLYGHKKLPADRSSPSLGTPRADDNIASVRNVTVDDNHRSSVDSEASSRQISRASSVHLDNNVRLNTSYPESTQLEKIEASAKSSWNYRPGRSTSTRNSPRLSIDNRGDASILSKELSRPSLDSRQTGRLSLDIRDVVRDSFYRDSSKLSLETKLDEKSQKSRDGHKYVLKPMDSPRPPTDARDSSKQQQQLSMSPSSRKGQKPKSQFQTSSDINVNSRNSVSQASSDVTKTSTTPVDLNESLKVLVKLREAPWNFVDNKEPPRPSFELKEGPRSSFSKDSPRFSYDGRDIPRSSSLKLREAPRLSLDSREISRNSVELKGNCSGMDTPKIMHKHRRSHGDLTEMEHQCSERKRSPSVVARLMGLEEMPADSTPTSQKTGTLYLSQSEEKCGFKISPEARKSFQYCKAMEPTKQATEKENSSVDSLKKRHFQTRCSDEGSEHVEETIERLLGSPRSIQSLKSPSLKHLDAIPKPLLMQRCPIEPAPWRQQDGGQSYQRKAFESQNFSDAPKKNERPAQVLYSEIEKRLKQLEHEHCGKDLKTLKQILEAMHHKGLLDSTKEKFNHHENDYTPSSRISQEGKAVYKAREMQDNQLTSGISNSTRTFQAPIVIMKPTKLVDRSSNSSVNPLDGFPNYQRKVSSVLQPGSSNTKISTMGDNRALKDQQSGRPNSRGSANHYNNEPIAIKNHRREHNSRIKSIENSNDVLQKGTPRPVSPASSPSTRNQLSSKEVLNRVKNNHPSCSVEKIQRKKPEIERKPKQSGSLKSSRQGTKQIGSETENRSPRNWIRTKGGHAMQIDTMSESSRDTVADQCPETPRADEISVRSDSNISSISQMDYEVTSKLSDVNADYDCRRGNGNRRLLQSNGSVDSHPKLGRTLEFSIEPKTSGTKTKSEVQIDLVKSKNEEIHSEIDEVQSEMDEIHLNCCEELSTTSTAPEVSEQPSPVSVLDASSFYKDDSSVSPIKKSPITFKEHETRRDYDENSGGAYHWNSFTYESHHRTPDSPIAINNKILKNVHSLVRKLDDLNCSSTENNTIHLHLKSTDSLQTQIPDYKYVKEILMASGILFINADSISADSFHASGFAINPELFNVLEQRRTPKYGISAEYIQGKHKRQLLFKTVNEILGRKLHPYLNPQPWIRKKDSPCMAAALTRPSGQHLLKQVWEELQSLQASCNSNSSSTSPLHFCDPILHKELSDNAEGWNDYRTEVSELVLAVERNIFKDLIDETLSDLGFKNCTTRRQLLFH